MKQEIIKIIHDVVVRRTGDCKIAEERAAQMLLEKFYSKCDDTLSFMELMVEQLNEKDYLCDRGLEVGMKTIKRVAETLKD